MVNNAQFKKIQHDKIDNNNTCKNKLLNIAQNDSGWELRVN